MSPTRRGAHGTKGDDVGTWAAGFVKTAIVVVAFVMAGGALAPGAWAAPGDFDQSLAGTGKVLTSGGAGDEIALAPNGKILQIGHSSGGWVLAQHLPDGSLDQSFNPGGAKPGMATVAGTAGGYVYG